MKRRVLLSLTCAFFGIAILSFNSVATAVCLTPRFLGCCLWLEDDGEGNPVLGLDCQTNF